ncbi:AraC family transcriptional regulator [Defluviimonas sp. WL0075]|uniref:AraC family transcriptional regulator n=1 Tax=Albidovulum sediminicola TaxID=2984331 RepID=A0ABT2Z228_9RHOB|nr:AraC family transcriptional regulator [Defluviimonas sp. WL0075]MCV2865183.1 AraC family transcriptional regulator [Defluviimonas sp. WL0075]
MTKPMNIATASAEPVLRREPKRYVFFLLRSFSALDLCAALDALKEANSFDGTARYTWTTLSEDGNPVVASNGLGFTADGMLSNLDRRDTVIVLGGDDFVSAGTLPVQAWLRRQARKGVTVGGLRRAAFVLARAGLLDDHETAAHWSCQAALKEVHPDLEITRGVFQMGEARFTGAGGASTLDIMIHLISREQGTDVATWVADRLVYSAHAAGGRSRPSATVAGWPAATTRSRKPSAS